MIVFAADLKVLPLAVFGVVLAITLGVTYWAAKRTSCASDFYAAGRGITGFQNGWAIAGDYMSASSFLGFAGLIFLFGVDAFVGLMAAIIAFVPVLLFLAERMRNSGKFTLADVLSFRLRERPARLVAAVGTLVGRDHLPARADGRRGRADPGADRHHVHAGRDHRRRVHARLRDLRRHARHHVGADHQGDAADGRGRRADAVRAAPRSASTRSSCSAGAASAHPKGDGLPRARPAVRLRPRAAVVRPRVRVRHRRAAAHPHALLHRAGRQGGARLGRLGRVPDRRLLPHGHVRRRRRAGDPDAGRREGRRARPATSRSPSWRSTSAAARAPPAATSSWPSSPRSRSRRSSRSSPGS